MKIRKVLVANRGEIAIRILRACVELKLRTVAVYTFEDRYSLHRYKADESYQLGKDNEPLKPYLDIDEIINLALEKNVDAIHPGYGFLSENEEFARKCRENGIIFIGPEPEVMAQLGDKVAAKEVAKRCEVPIIESSEKTLTDVKTALAEAKRIGFPVMLKAASGGGGRGMRVIREAEELENAFNEAKREAGRAFGDDTVFLEKFIENPKHIEVQIVADNEGNTIHLHERDCSVQRRFQKVVEVAPAMGLGQDVRKRLFDYAIKIAKAVKYNNVGTVEFLVDPNGEIFFIEVNPRIQVEHTVTEMVTGIDIVKLQIRIAMGFKLYEDEIAIPDQTAISVNGFAIQCRITAEDPENDFKPDHGTLITYRPAEGFGIRLDPGSVYSGVRISPFFDSLLVKVCSHSRTLDGAARKMTRCLQEYRIRGVKTNIRFVENIVNHDVFKRGEATVNFIKEHPELFKFVVPRDRATRIVKFLGEISVNGNPDVKFVDENKVLLKPVVPEYERFSAYPKGTKDLLNELGAERFAEWLRKEKSIHYTDTTFRDAHQSLFATRMRTFDMLRVAESYAKNHPEIFSFEVWGGATFDVALRFLHEDPWERLAELRKAIPNVLLQMLIRGSNGVGYKAYPDNMVEKFVEKSWETGVDIFRIFDSLNWMKGIGPCIEYVRSRTEGIAEGAMCYTGDILDPQRSKYNLNYYLQLAKDIENAGAHILAIKDMAGLLKPYAATELVTALKDTVKIPIHLHTHDTSSLQPATYLKAIEAGVDVVDVALGSVSGLTSQPNFNSVVEMMRFHEREQKVDIHRLNEFSNYFDRVRDHYYPFESGLKASTASVFEHEIPGGQYSNLKPQATALGLAEKFEDIKLMYAKVNDLFGDVIKVTPSSKVVGDMALYLVSNGFTIEDVMEKGDTISFPESVVDFFMGRLGQPHGGFPKELQKIILKDKEPFTDRPNSHLEPIDFEKGFAEFKKKFDASLKMTDYLSYLMYPKVFEDYYAKKKEYGDISKVPTGNFFFGMKLREETLVEIGEGKNIIIELLSIGPADDNGMRTLFFRVNGMTRNIEVLDKSLNIQKVENEKADKNDPNQIGAPLQGLLSKVLVKKGTKVKKNQPLFIIEAMKMETTVTASENTTVKRTVLEEGTLVEADDLVLVTG
ncbi:MAG: pyruvate carboxylase [Flavobacteriales bacterium]|nr:pyruvate carboxylase [Flavobacteriales bacterium]